MYSYLLALVVALVSITPNSAVYNSGIGVPNEIGYTLRRLIITKAYELIQGINDDVRLAGTNTINEFTHRSGDFELVLKLWLYADDGLDPDGRCFGGPGGRPTQILLGSTIKILLRILLTNHFKATIENGYGGGFGILGQVGLFYAYRRFQAPSSTRAQIQTASPALLDIHSLPNGYLDHPDCWIYYSSITSGFDDDPYSVLGSGKCLSSPNRLYELCMQEDCNLVLYEDNGSGSVWATETENEGTGCYLKAQVDSNLVIYTRDEVAVWSIGISCGPLCLSSTSFTLQDDRNFVGYHTSSGQAFFASRTNI